MADLTNAQKLKATADFISILESDIASDPTNPTLIAVRRRIQDLGVQIGTRWNASPWELQDALRSDLHPEDKL